MHTRDDPDPLLATTHRNPKVETPSPATVARTADAASSDARSMLELQRLAGNASVSRLVAREPAATEEAEEATEAPAGRSPVLDVVGRGGGEPLSPDLRTEMEGRLGADFGSVRVHRDAAASASAKAVDAHAYTVGNDVVFRSDRWDPSSSEGKHTLAHELSHVVQQASGPVDGSPAAGGIRVSSPDDDFEQAADRHADAALAGPAPAAPAGVGAPSAASAGPSAQLEEDADAVQRQKKKDTEEPEELDEEEMAAGTAQREAAPEDELEDEELGVGAVQREVDPEEELEEGVPG